MSCKEAQESLYDFSNNGNETSYTYLTSHINAMIGIVQLADDDFSINELNNDLIICHTYLIEAPEESKMHIDLLNESLLLYLNDANTEGAHIRLKAFNNRVHQELNYALIKYLPAENKVASQTSRNATFLAYEFENLSSKNLLRISVVRYSSALCTFSCVPIS